jgi:glycosyltransferase involved in cell wall biosynthesis
LKLQALSKHKAIAADGSLNGRAFAASIIIPLLDQQDEWLDQCLRSALGQTTPCEVVVVSSPRTRPSNLALLKSLRSEFVNLRLIRREVLGFPGALNAGFRAASAERIGLLLSDDWLDPHAVELCLGRDADIVSSGNQVYAADGKSIYEDLGRCPTIEKFLRCETLERKASCLQHFFLLRKSKLLEIGGADESLGDFPGIDDYDMIWVLLEHGASVAIVEQALYNYRDHEGERLSLQPAQKAIAVLERILNKHSVPASQREPIRKLHWPWYERTLHRAYSDLQKTRS